MKADTRAGWALASIVALLALVACGKEPAGALGADRAAEVDEAVRALAESISRDLALEGPEAWLRYFEDSETFFMVSDGEIKFASFADAEKFIGEFAPGVESMAIAWDSLRVEPVTAEAAVMASAYQELINETSGSQLAFSGYLTALAVKTPSGWRLSHLHWSSGPPAAEE